MCVYVMKKKKCKVGRGERPFMTDSVAAAAPVGGSICNPSPFFPVTNLNLVTKTTAR